jgi:glutamine amidotransferase-like uncharacterized protein
LLTTLYDGGPVFDIIPSSPDLIGGSPSADPLVKPKDDANIEIIARYTNLPETRIAIIGGAFGKGRYILSSPHIEKFGLLLTDGLYKLLNNSYEREKAVMDALLPHEQKQKEFFKDILNRLIKS